MMKAPRWLTQKTWLDRVLQQVKREDRSAWQHLLVFMGLVALCVIPPTIWSDRGFIGYGGDGWALWPALVTVIVLILAMLDDHLERSPRDRVLAVLLEMGFYFGMYALLVSFLPLKDHSISGRALFRATLTTGPLAFALDCSRTMVRWKHHSDATRYDRFGDPYLQ